MDYMCIVWVTSATAYSSGFWLGSANGASAGGEREGGEGGGDIYSPCSLSVESPWAVSLG